MPNVRKTVVYEFAKAFDLALASLDPQQIANIARLYGRKLAYNEDKPIAVFARHLWDTVSNVPNEPEMDGEFWLLGQLTQFKLQTIFDVGANIGGWSTAALNRNPQARVHCFEITPTTFIMLQGALAPFADRVVLNDFGLLDTVGAVDVHVSSSHYVSSIYKVQLPAEDTVSMVESKVMTGDDYLGKHGIAQVDLLKIDVEGAERKVMDGFRGAFAAGTITLLQFEYNLGAVYGGFLLKDIYEMLTPHGYAIGKLTPSGVVFRDFMVEHENFSGPNYIACRTERKDIIDAISWKG